MLPQGDASSCPTRPFLLLSSALACSAHPNSYRSPAPKGANV